MQLRFYERVGFGGRRPSSFSWRIRYAPAHKVIDFDVHPLRFSDVEATRRLSGLSHSDHRCGRSSTEAPSQM